MQCRIQRDTVRYDTMRGVMFLVASNGSEACCRTKRVECPYWSAEVTSPKACYQQLTSRAVIYFEAYKTCCVKCGAHRPRWDFNSPHPFFFFTPATLLCLLATTTATSCLESVEIFFFSACSHITTSAISRVTSSPFSSPLTTSPFLDYYRFTVASVTAASGETEREREGE